MCLDLCWSPNIKLPCRAANVFYFWLQNQTNSYIETNVHLEWSPIWWTVQYSNWWKINHNLAKEGCLADKWSQYLVICICSIYTISHSKNILCKTPLAFMPLWIAFFSWTFAIFFLFVFQRYWMLVRTTSLTWF